MRINTNILSLSAQRQLSNTTKAFARAMERLASGNRVNSARDDAAGLAIGTGLEAQRRGLSQAIRNMNDSRGFLNTAEGAMAAQTEILQRLRELALQSANGTLSDQNRADLDNEFQKLYDEFNRITAQTQFNGTNVLDGSLSNLNVQVGTKKGENIALTINKVELQGSVDSSTVVSGTGSFSLGSNGGGTSTYEEMALDDFDNDGDLDYVLNNQVFRGNGNGTFTQVQTLTDTTPDWAVAGDVNGDGNIDLMVTEGSRIRLRLGNGNSTFQAASTLYDITGGVTAGGPSLGDIDNDNDLDIAFVDQTNLITYLMQNDGTGVFSIVRTFNTGSAAYATTLGDITGDGRADLMVSRRTVPGAQVQQNNSNGTWTTLATTGNGGQQIRLADFNNDGNVDYVQDGTATTITIGLGAGDGTFSTSTITAGNANSTKGLEVSDLNQDGNMDFVRTATTAGLIEIFLGDGTGSFTKSTITPGGSPANVKIGDIDGDGFDDLIVKQSSTVTKRYIQTTTSSTVETSIPFDITTQENAEDVLDIIDETLASILQIRSSVGALQSRLDFAAANTQTMAENIAAARSRIIDTDYAQEMSEFMRLQILQQAGLSVLSQANLNSKQMLKLLENL